MTVQVWDLSLPKVSEHSDAIWGTSPAVQSVLTIFHNGFLESNIYIFPY